VLTITLWTTRQDAERYEREFYPRVLDIVKPFLDTPVEVSYSNLETTLCDGFVDCVGGLRRRRTIRNPWRKCSFSCDSLRLQVKRSFLRWS